MRSALKQNGWRVWVALGCLGSLLNPLPALAATEVVPLERLNIQDVILLPTIHSQYEARFTKPKTWQVQPSSHILVDFQHAHQLQPHRSWLQVIVNDKVIRHVPLTRENVTGTQLNIPMPVHLLKDFNTLNFRVEQHYADRCEDPVDKSLWTQILPSTKMVFHYNPVAPTVDFSEYPYPIIDALTYSPAQVQYVTSAQATDQELHALALVNTHLAQRAHKEKELKTRVQFNRPTAGAEGEHLIFVGAASRVGGAAPLISGAGDYALSNGRWVHRQSGQPVPNDQGVLVFTRVPGSMSKTVLVVSGNSEQGVLKAAQYLTNSPSSAELAGSALTTPAGWSSPGTRSNKPPRYIEGQSRSFRELGFGIQEVHKINAPPIIYKVPIVGDFRNQNGKLWLDLVYSYSENLNPEYSSLELRMNDVSIANIPLTNPQGEQLKRASIPVSNELIRPRNDLVAQFHLMPDKYGWCVDNYEDHAWGKILDDSRFRVEGHVPPRLPDLGLLNDTMYPYAKTDNLQHLHLVLPTQPSAELLNAMLGFTSRLGRATQSETDLRLTLSRGFQNVSGDRHVMAFRDSTDSLRLPEGARLTWQVSDGQLMKSLSLSDRENSRISMQLIDQPQGTYLEQYTTGGHQVMTVLTASSDDGFLNWAKILETDKLFEPLSEGFLQQASLLNPDLNAVTETTYHQEVRRGTPAASDWWSNLVRWAKNLPWTLIVAGLVGLFFLMLALPLLVLRFRRKR